MSKIDIALIVSGFVIWPVGYIAAKEKAYKVTRIAGPLFIAAIIALIVCRGLGI